MNMSCQCNPVNHFRKLEALMKDSLSQNNEVFLIITQKKKKIEEAEKILTRSI